MLSIFELHLCRRTVFIQLITQNLVDSTCCAVFTGVEQDSDNCGCRLDPTSVCLNRMQFSSIHLSNLQVNV